MRTRVCASLYVFLLLNYIYIKKQIKDTRIKKTKIKQSFCFTIFMTIVS